MLAGAAFRVGLKADGKLFLTPLSPGHGRAGSDCFPTCAG